MMLEEGHCRNLVPRPIDIRSKVHEYGGGAYTVSGDTLYFVVAEDQTLYSLGIYDAAAIPVQITQANTPVRYADIQVDTARNRLLAVCEDHTQGDIEATNTLVSISLEANSIGTVNTLVAGADFYSNPRLSPNGKHLCWISWQHPNMPWDTSTLRVADLDDAGDIVHQVSVNAGQESLVQPRWSPGNELYVVSDRNNWWNIYRYCRATHALVPVLEQNAEFATPPWTFNMSSYDFLDDTRIVATFTEKAIWHLCRIETETGKRTMISPSEHDCSVIFGISADKGRCAFVGGSPTSPNALRILQDGKIETLTQTANLDHKGIAQAQAMTFPTTGGEMAHGFYYPPSQQNAPLPGTLPPTIVICHGGPTGSTDSGLNLKIQYWVTRGFAVCDVNYRGSTGYGRQYRESLHQNWGVKDVDDVCAAAQHLIAMGKADKNKIVIKGSSAGGYTVLAALAFRDVFSAGVSLYGIGDLEILATDTHKFEARSLDKLIGKYPEEQAVYRDRSPVHFAHKITCPLLVFQGLKDKVVPPNQASQMVDAVKANGLPVAYVTFADEGHGFHNIDNIERMLDDELYFYCKVFDLPVPEYNNSQLTITNLP